MKTVTANLLNTVLSTLCVGVIAILNVGICSGGEQLNLYGPEKAASAGGYSPFDQWGRMGTFNINGYADAGGLFNANSADWNVISANSKSDLGLNAAYVSLEKAVRNNGCGPDFGFGLDFMYGTDYRYMRSYAGLDQDWNTGDDGYGFAMPQIYGELAFNQWSVKFGHFYSLLGYEQAREDRRFFYSTSLAFDFRQVTTTGVLFNYNGFDNWDFSFGWINGDDTGFSNDYGESMVTGMARYHCSDWASVKWALQIGDGGVFGDGTDEFVNSFTFNVRCSSHWGYALEYNYANYYRQNWAASHYNVIGNHIYYTINKAWQLGARVEWLGLVKGLDGGEFTFGANWNPWRTLFVRPEIRYDWGNAERFDLGAEKDQLALGFDIRYDF